ncbi:MAG: N-6 DNA methylase, partial [Gemmatimonadales bacterium]|nr:N-6 DNA methylase [Gemmatimonadales bacterium]
LAVAAPRVGTAGTTRALLIECAQPSAFALEQLRALGPHRAPSALAHALRVAEVLSAEAVGETFFRAFQRTWGRMAATLPDRFAESDRQLVALQALTRVLFLYFVQAKGWLDGNPAFLRGLLDATIGRGGGFHRHALNPLFFGTLNRPAAERTNRLRGKIPYLNGGLFAPHPVERRLGRVHFPDEEWVAAFEGLFDRYRFCVREADELEVVAPDMLGRVFERLMEPGQRARSGTFFTPESVVRELVSATFGTALAGTGGLSTATVDRLMAGGNLAADERMRASAAVRRLRVLDPAVGSGAFLLGTLDTLTDLVMHLTPSPDPVVRWRLRRRILRDNLFGVDINPLAVRLAELRLWLAVVADDPATDIGAVEPLPNLDGIVRQGNTLFDPVAAARAFHPHLAPVARQLARGIAVARGSLFDARGPQAMTAAARLHRREADLARGLLDHAIAAGDYILRELAALTEGTDLFGRPVRLSAQQRLRHRSVSENLIGLRRARSAVEEGELPFFSFDVHLPDVMAAGGFDVVVGNPPWVRAERIGKDERRRLQLRFALWRGNDGRGFQHLPDLAVAFLERALELVAADGAVGFLLPSKIASAGYGESARRHLVRDTTITYLHRVPDAEARRFGATTYPLAVVVRKAVPQPDHAVQLGFREHAELRQKHLEQPGPWILVPDRALDAVRHLRRSGRALREIATPHLGVKTGADGVFVGTVLNRSSAGWQVRFPGGHAALLEPEVLRPALRGRDLARFSATAARVVIWGYATDGTLRHRMPPSVAEYLGRHGRTLERRADYRSGPCWSLFRTGPVLLGHRVVWSDIARILTAVVVDETLPDAVPLNSCYVASFPDRETALVA